MSKAPGRATLGGPPVGWSEDLDRVIALERRRRVEEGSPEAAELSRVVTRWHRRERAGLGSCECAQIGKPCIAALRPVQAWALFELAEMRGLFGSIGPGWGKTAIDVLAPMALEGCRLAVALVPSTVTAQLATDYRHVAQHFRVPAIRIHGSNPYHCPRGDAMPDGSPAPVLHVMPYSRLSAQDASTFLESLSPDLVIADEMQNLGDMKSTRTRRLLRYFEWAERQGIDARFAGMTGTPTDSAIADYWHLLLLALRERAPLPLVENIMVEWGRALNASPSGWPAPAGELERLDDTADHVQIKYFRRLVESPGVVSTVTPSSDVAVTVRECYPDGGVPRALADLIDDVRETWTRPDGLEVFESKVEQWRCLHNLACGFYHRWIFTRGTDPEIDRWVARRKGYNRAVRTVLEANVPCMDSPLLCARAAARFLAGEPDRPEAPTWDCPEFEPWLEVQGDVEYYSEAVRVDDFLARDVAKWAIDAGCSGDPGVVWYESVELGVWIAEISAELGLALPLHDGGPDAGPRMNAERGDRSVIASIKSHGTGRDGMQHKFRRMRFTQPMASSQAWEQAICRLARPGQTGDVLVEHYAHTEELRDSVEKARERALYVQRTTGQLQKLLTGRSSSE